MIDPFGLLACGAIALVMAAAWLSALRLRVRPILWATGVVSFVVAVYLANPNHRVYCFHGFFHASIIYQLLRGDIPPEDYLFAGTRLLYPWGYELVATAVTELAHTAPATSIAIVNVAALCATLRQLFRIAGLLEYDRTTALLAASLPLLGVTFLDFGPIAVHVSLLLHLPMEFRGTPPLSVYSHVTGATLGILCFTTALAAALRTARGEGTRFTPVVIFCAVLGAGFLYPLQFLGIVPSVLAAVVLSAAGGSPEAKRRAARIALAAFAASAILLPYFLEVGTGKSATGRPSLAPNLRYAAMNLAHYATTALPLLAVVCWQRQASFDHWRTRARIFSTLLCFVVVPAAVFLLLAVPEDAQYKCRILAAVGLGIFAAPAVGALLAQHRWIGAVFLWLLLFPLATDLQLKTAGDWHVLDPFRVEGRYLVHLDPDQAALYEWISTGTDPRAVFIDSYLTIPIFGRRVLWVATDIRRSRIPGPRPHDGWGTTPGVLLRLINGHPDAEIYRRTVIATAMLGGSDQAIAQADVDEVHRTIPGREVFVVARDPETRTKLAADGRFEQRFANAAAAAYRLR